MKVCAEYEDQITAFAAHRTLIDKGVSPGEIELRSPYPLAEHPIPEHNVRPMIMRNIVRVFWLLGVIGGFCFLTVTQLEWGLTAKTSGQPLVSVPINAIIMYETGMITAILMTTLMFFVETRRYRQLVPALEEDMVVANGYLALVVSGEGAKKAKEWLENSSARSIVSYVLPLALMSTMLTGCATFNLRYQPVIKPGEAAADAPPAHSVAMPSAAQQEVEPPQPYGWLTFGDQAAYDRMFAEMRATEREIEQRRLDGELSNREARQESEKVRDRYAPILAEIAPAVLQIKNNTTPPELKNLPNPVSADELSLQRGAELYRVNCAQCHGVQGNGDGRVGEVWGPPPPAVGSADYATRLTDGDMYHFIASGKGNMPFFAYKMTAGEIWDVVNHIRALQSGGGE